MKLSIITINKNNSNGLRKTMESVFTQSYQDFNYFVIDGASSDNSLDEIAKFSKEPRFCWISEPDSGIYNAMNKGISVANGEYLLFLNSGDYLINSEVLNDVFEKNAPTCDIICAKCNVSEKGKVVWTSDPPEHITLGTLYLSGLAHQSTFIRKKLFTQYGKYREDFRFNSDIEFWYRTIIWGEATTEKVSVITTDYNLEGISTAGSKSDQYLEEMAEILSTPALRRILPDYDEFKNKTQVFNEYNWINDKPIIRKSLRLLHKLFH